MRGLHRGDRQRSSECKLDRCLPGCWCMHPGRDPSHLPTCLPACRRPSPAGAARARRHRLHRRHGLWPAGAPGRGGARQPGGGRQAGRLCVARSCSRVQQQRRQRRRRLQERVRMASALHPRSLPRPITTASHTPRIPSRLTAGACGGGCVSGAAAARRPRVRRRRPPQLAASGERARGGGAAGRHGRLRPRHLCAAGGPADG